MLDVGNQSSKVTMWQEKNSRTVIARRYPRRGDPEGDGLLRRILLAMTRGNNWFKNTFIYDLFGKRSYAQCGEDLIVLELLKDIKKGNYLEIGAYHPKVFSNTYLFYKKGWRGTVVEPNERMSRLYKDSRPGDEVIDKGVTGYQGNKVAEYYVFEEETRNTFSKEMAERYKVQGERQLRVERKRVVQLNEVLKKNVDLLSIDTEGLDEEIVKSLAKLKIRPKVIIVEGEGAGEVLEKTNYKLVGLTGYSRIYLYTPLDSPFPLRLRLRGDTVERGKGERI